MMRLHYVCNLYMFVSVDGFVEIDVCGRFTASAPIFESGLLNYYSVPITITITITIISYI